MALQKRNFLNLALAESEYDYRKLFEKLMTKNYECTKMCLQADNIFFNGACKKMLHQKSATFVVRGEPLHREKKKKLHE